MPDCMHSASILSEEASDSTTESSLRDVAWLNRLAGVSSV